LSCFEFRNDVPILGNLNAGVAKILTEEGDVTDINVIEAAILHDTVEDTETTFEELEELFGPHVTGIVREVTDDKALPKEQRKALQISSAGKKSPQAKLVKMADKIYNLRDLERNPPPSWTQERRNEYFVWAQKVVVQCYHVNSKLAGILQEIFQRNIPK